MNTRVRVGSAMETQHIQCGERTGAATSAAFLLATAFLACPTRANGRTAKPGEAPTPRPPRFGGSENVEKSVRDCGRIECASKYGSCDGALEQVRGAKRDGDARWRARDVWGAQPTRAARRRPRRSPRACGTRWEERRRMGVRCAYTDGGRVHYACGRAHAWCILPPVRRPGWTRGAFVWQLLCHKAHAG